MKIKKVEPKKTIRIIDYYVIMLVTVIVVYEVIYMLVRDRKSSLNGTLNIQYNTNFPYILVLRNVE